MTDAQAIERLKRVAGEYWLPGDLQLAVALIVESFERQAARISELENLLLSASSRIHAQSELLSKRAEVSAN